MDSNKVSDSEVLGFQIPSTAPRQIKINGVPKNAVQTKLKAVKRQRKQVISQPTVISSGSEDEEFFQQQKKVKINDKSKVEKSSVEEEAENLLDSKLCVDLGDFFAEENIDVRNNLDKQLEMISLGFGADEKDLTNYSFPLKTIFMMIFLLKEPWFKILMDYRTLEKLLQLDVQCLLELRNSWSEIEMAETFAQPTGIQTSLWSTWLNYIREIYRLTSLPFDKWQIGYVKNLPVTTIDTSVTSLCLRDLSLVHESLQNLNNSGKTPVDLINLKSSQSIPTTSTSATLAPTQTKLVVVPGLKQVKHGGNGEDRDLGAALSRLTSRLNNGTPSLDITIQMASNPYTSKAEMVMEDLVYDLKIYR